VASRICLDKQKGINHNTMINISNFFTLYFKEVLSKRELTLRYWWNLIDW